MTNKDNEMILVFDKEVFESIGLIEDMLAVDVLAPLNKIGRASCRERV